MTPVEARLLLSDREWEAMNLRKKGLKCSEIARRLGVVEGVVKNLIAASRKKLGDHYQDSGKLVPAVAPIHIPHRQTPGLGSQKTEKERLADDLIYGRAAMAYRRHVTSVIDPTAEDHLAGGINGICSRKVLLKKRCEARNVITLTAKYKVIKSNVPIGPATRLELGWGGLRTVRTDVDIDDAVEDKNNKTTTRHYWCKSLSDYENLMSAIRADIAQAQT